MENDISGSQLRRPTERRDSDFGAGLRILFTTRLGLSILVVISAVLLLPYSGFCISTFRFLSDEEAINAAIDEVLRIGAHTIEMPDGGRSIFVPERPVRYSSRDEFRRANPTCCRIVSNDPLWVGLRHELFGLAAKSVLMKYKVNYITENGVISNTDAVARYPVSNCGHVLNLGR